MVGRIVGGWQLSGLFQAQSGRPLNITSNGRTTTPRATSFPEPDRKQPRRSATRTGKRYFDASVYSYRCRQQGDMTRNGGPDRLLGDEHVAVQRFAFGGGSVPRVPRRLVQRGQLAAMGEPEHLQATTCVVRQHLQAGDQHPGRRRISGPSGSAARSCSRQGQHQRHQGHGSVGANRSAARWPMIGLQVWCARRRAKAGAGGYSIICPFACPGHDELAARRLQDGLQICSRW